MSGLIETLSKFESLTDLHILHPSSAPHTHVDGGRPLSIRVRVTARSPNEREEAEAPVMELLSALPGLCRVGIGRFSVWERETRWKGDCLDELHVQMLPRAKTPSFYEADSPLSLKNGEEENTTRDDGEPSIGDVLMLFKCL